MNAMAKPPKVEAVQQSFHLTAPLSKLKEAISLAHAHRGPPCTIPILACVLVKATEEGFTITQTSLDIVIEISGDGAGSGEIALPLRALHAFLSNAEGDEVTIDFTAGGGRAKVTCGPYTAQIVPLPATDFPACTPHDHTCDLLTGEGVLSHLFDLTIPFISTDDTRYYLNGVCFEWDGKALMATATDGRRLAHRRAALAINAPAAPPIIVPTSLAKIAHKLASRREVPIRFNAQWMQFDFGHVQIGGSLIDGTYPDWRRILSYEHPVTIPFEAKKALRALKMITDMGNLISNHAAAISHSDAGLVMTSDRDRYDENGASMTIEGQFPPFAPFGVNSHYVATAIKALQAQKLTWHLPPNPQSDPSMISSADGIDQGFAIIMPMRI